MLAPLFLFPSSGYLATDRHLSEGDLRVAHNMRRLRLEAGLPLRAIGAVLGLTIQAIHRIEMGQSRLFVSQVLLCAEVLRVPVDAFFYEDGEAKPKRPVELAIGEELLTAIRALPEKKLRALLALSRQLADKLQRPIG